MSSLRRCFILLVLFFVAPGPLVQAKEKKPSDGAKSVSRGATKQEVEQLRQEVAELKAAIQRLLLVNQQGTTAPRLVEVSAVQPGTSVGPAQAAAGAAPKDQQKPPTELKFPVGGGEVQLYGHADVSFDYVDNGLANRIGAVGNNGWLSQLSSNLSYFGVRGSRKLAPRLTGVFQIETEVSFSATPGPTSDAQVKHALGSRDTYVGMQGDWGAVKIGKEDAPYKRSTARMDPFVNSIGDSRSIMGNSGGDNRAEFKTRISHAVWYESPNLKGFNASLLFSPGQNRASDNSIIPRAEPICAGGDNPPFNERTRPVATWLAITQKITATDDLNLGWAHAGKTPGDPGGVINQPTMLNLAGPIDNRSNLFDAGLKHHFSDKRTTVYFVFAQQKNHRGAHYDIGANGHTAVVDDKDGGGNAFAGTKIRAVSGGVTYDF